MSRLRQRRSLKKSAGFLREDQSGVAAIEFGMLALPFLALLFAILETGLVFFASSVLDSAVEQSSRKIWTGQSQTQGDSIDDYRAEICTKLYGLFDCNELRISVKTVGSFTSAKSTPPTDPATGDWTVAEAFSPGQSSDVELVEVHYKWPTILDIHGFNLANSGTSDRLMTAVRVFKNEPFGSTK